jgi:hypothetical protein
MVTGALVAGVVGLGPGTAHAAGCRNLLDLAQAYDDLNSYDVQQAFLANGQEPAFSYYWNLALQDAQMADNYYSRYNACNTRIP